MPSPSLCLWLFVSSLALINAQHASSNLLGNSFGLPFKNATYDYIIIGGGTVGLTIAARLAQNASNSVAVIEAGGFYEIDNGNDSVIPALSTSQYVGADPDDTQPLIDWGFVTTPQAGAGGRRLHYARGKTLGGSSARNYMAYHRGSVGSYKRWADEVGDASYEYRSFERYFKRSANLTAPDYEKRGGNGEPGGNGTVYYDPRAFEPKGGPLSVSWSNYATPFFTWAGQALEKAGIPVSKIGFNSGVLNGSAWATLTIDPTYEHRESSETSYLQMAIKQTEIKVYHQAMVKQILFDRTSRRSRATGVRVETAGKQYTITARKEIVLSAGAFQSPQLLMVSGIGPLETLQAHNITPNLREGLPGVGQNMWDQPLFGISYRVNVLTGSASINRPDLAVQADEEYLRNQSGPLTSAAGFLSWEKLPEAHRANLSQAAQHDLAAFPSDWPELEYPFLNAYTGYNRNYMDPEYKQPGDERHQYATIAAAPVAPISRGNISIRSADMADPPLINPAWLTTDTDVEVAIAAFKRLREIWSNMRITIGEEYLPGPEVQTDQQILDFIRKSVIQLYHAAASCKMGREDDPMAVVDTQARVYGVDGLRVVDASSMPFLPPGHPQATIYALAEKIAEDIMAGR